MIWRLDEEMTWGHSLKDHNDRHDDRDGFTERSWAYGLMTYAGGDNVLHIMSSLTGQRTHCGIPLSCDTPTGLRSSRYLAVCLECSTKTRAYQVILGVLGYA